MISFGWCLIASALPRGGVFRQKDAFLRLVSLPPDHLVDYACVGLDDLDDLCGDVLVGVVRDRKTEITVAVHFDGGVNGLQEILLIDASEDEAGLVKSFGALGAGADADGRERVADARKVTTLLWQGTTVANYSESVHLKAVVVVESERLMLNHAVIEIEAALLKAFARSWMATV